jgi:hypothetical protein
MDDFTDDSDDEQLAAQNVFLPIEPVQIVPFPDFNNLQPVIPLPVDEIQIADLLGFVNPEPKPIINNQKLQVGMVQLITPQVDPVMASILQGASTSSPNPDAIRLWVKFFSQKLNSISPVSILDPWLSFFLFLLLQNPTFGWAKDFL